MKHLYSLIRTTLLFLLYGLYTNPVSAVNLRLPDNSTQDVDFVAVVPVRKVSADSYAVLIGQDRGNSTVFKFPSGQVEKSETNAAAVGFRELVEETGGKTSPFNTPDINRLVSASPWVYDAPGKKVYFFLDMRQCPSLSAVDDLLLTKLCKAQINDPRARPCEKEMQQYVTVPTQTFLGSLATEYGKSSWAAHIKTQDDMKSRALKGSSGTTSVSVTLQFQYFKSLVRQSRNVANISNSFIKLTH